MIKGVLPALITPLDENENINVGVLEKLMTSLIKQGADGFYVGGATGEGYALRLSERKILTEEAVKISKKAKLSCIIQVASTDFNAALMLAKHAEEKGADAISATPPLFFSYSENDVYDYYKKLADAVHIPLVVYYNPFSKFPMDAKFAKRLFEIENVTSIKWTSSDFYQMMILKSITNGEMGIFNGFDEMLLMGLCAGADGGIGTTYNYQLEYVKGVYNSFIYGDIKQAMKYQTKISETVASFNSEPVIPVSKVILEHMGYNVGNATFPMKRYNKQEKSRIFANTEPHLPFKSEHTYHI